MPRKKQSLSKRINRLEKVSRPEVKHRDYASGAFDTIGSVSGTLLNPQSLTQGSARNHRVGDKVKSRNIRFQAIFKQSDGAQNSSTAIRLLVLRSKIQDPTTSDMPTWYGAVDKDKFFVLEDRMMNSNTTWYSNATFSGSLAKRVNVNVSTGLRKLQYDGTGDQSPLNNEVVIYMLASNQSGEVAYNMTHYYIDN